MKATPYSLYRVVLKGEAVKIAGFNKEHVLSHLEHEHNLSKTQADSLELQVLSTNFEIAKIKYAPKSPKKPRIMSSYYKIPLSEIFIEDNLQSHHAKELLYRFNIQNLGQLLETPDKYFLSARGCGIKTHAYIRERANNHINKTQ